MRDRNRRAAHQQFIIRADRAFAVTGTVAKWQMKLFEGAGGFSIAR